MGSFTQSTQPSSPVSSLSYPNGTKQWHSRTLLGLLYALLFSNNGGNPEIGRSSRMANELFSNANHSGKDRMNGGAGQNIHTKLLSNRLCINIKLQHNMMDGGVVCCGQNVPRTELKYGKINEIEMYN